MAENYIKKVPLGCLICMRSLQYVQKKDLTDQISCVRLGCEKERVVTLVLG
jgi:hypothetical protein